MPFNVFDTYYMAGMVEEIPPLPTFFRDRYFPTNDATDIFNTNKVLVEYQDGDMQMAPFVVPRAGDIPVARQGYEVHEFEPPFIAPSRNLTLDDLQKRGFGEALYPNSTPAQRAQALQLKDLTDLDRRITRREEWMAVQTMIHNGFSAIAYIDDSEVGEPIDLYFYDTNGDNPAIYTVAVKWDAEGGDYRTDVSAMVEDLLDRGLPAADLVLGSDAAAVLLNDEKTRQLLENRRMDFGMLAPQVTSPGVTWLGKLNFDGTVLDVFVAKESYQDGKNRVRLFPSTSAMVTAPGCGHMMYGRVDQLEPDEQYYSFAMRRVPKFVSNRDKDTRKLRLASRPLSAPLNKAPWIYAANVVGE